MVSPFLTVNLRRWPEPSQKLYDTAASSYVCSAAHFPSRSLQQRSGFRHVVSLPVRNL